MWKNYNDPATKYEISLKCSRFNFTDTVNELWDRWTLSDNWEEKNISLECCSRAVNTVLKPLSAVDVNSSFKAGYFTNEIKLNND